MPESFGDRLQHAWNAFLGRDPTRVNYWNYGYSSGFRADRVRLSGGSDRSIVTTVYNRIAIDVAAINIEHVRLDSDGRYTETIQSGLNNVLTIDANMDQTGRALIMDIVMSMFDEGTVAVVPVDTTINPEKSGSYDILTLRTGKIVEWFPKHIRVSLYNEETGRREEVLLQKKMVAIIENPLYAIMNEPNSTLQRLIRTLAKLDLSNENNASGKIDLIIQLPYVIKSKARQEQAEIRRKAIEAQLTGSKYGIAYTDGTERITQLNRGVENNLWTQVKELTSMLYNQLGLTQSVFDGTADEATMLNYYTRTVEPILTAICEEMMRKFLTKTARTQGQAIKYFRDPFNLIPVNELAEIADKFTRNEIATSNEIRAELGWKPASDPRADVLQNKNLNPSEFEQMPTDEEAPDYEGDLADLDDYDAQLDDLERSLGHSDADGELVHYANPYYDPVKAHEYYMRTRELKGRRHDTTGLNAEGKAAFRAGKEASKSNLESYKNGYKRHRDIDIRYSKSKTDTAIRNEKHSAESSIETHKRNTTSKIESLRKRLDSMSKEDKKAQRANIMAEIKSLREKNSAERKKIRAALSTFTKSKREEHKKTSAKARQDYDMKKLDATEEYHDILDRDIEILKSMPEYQARSRKRR